MQRQISKVIPVAAMLIPLAMLWFLPRWTVDDAFISYRYGANLHQFGELTWNPGEAPIEGYTGVLLPLLTSLLLSLGAPLLLGIKVISALATGGTALLLDQGLKKRNCSLPIRLIVLSLFLLTPIVYVHQSSGLETSIFTFLLIAVLHAHFLVLTQESKAYQSIVYLLLLLLLSITRPEGAFAAVLCLGGQMVFHWKENQKFKGIVLVLAWSIPAVLYFGWRLKYYGEWLPNSFAAKHSGGWINVESVKAAARFFGQYLMLPLAAAGLLWILSADKLRERAKTEPPLRQVGVIAGLFVAACLLVYLRSDLFMNFASRFFAPFLPLFLLFFGAMAGQAWESFQQNKAGFPVRYQLVVRLFAAAAILQVGIFAFKWRGELNFVKYYQTIVEDEYLPVAELLSERLPGNATIICYMDAGAIPFYTGLRTIDFGKLNDLYLARQSPGRQESIDYFFKQNADAVIMSSESGKEYVYLDEARDIMNDPRFQEFELLQVFGNRSDFPYFQWLFVRKSLE